MLGCALLAGGALAACQQKWVLDELGSDAGLSGSGGSSGSGGRAGGKGGGSGSSDASVDGRCTAGPLLQATPDVPEVVFALDRSTTMNQTFGSNGQTPLTVALSAIFAEVSSYGGGHGVRPSIDFAFLDFPDTAKDCNASMGCCPSDVTTNYNDFEQQATACYPMGSSSCLQSSLRPTATALSTALGHFSPYSSTQQYNERYVVLITNDDPDPKAMCTSNGCLDAITAVNNLTDVGATTEVVALGSSATCLPDLANTQHVFPTPYYPTQTPPNDLPTVIDGIMRDVAQDGCRLTLTSPPTSGHLAVDFDKTPVSQDPGTMGNGWNYDNNLRVYLHGSLCQNFLQGGSNTTSTFGLQIYDGCGPDHAGGNP
jgi:hypothetical protein